MIVSIIVCTCNRAEHLRQTLAAMAGVCVPESMPTELIVVDNASTDETVEVVQQCRLPNVAVRYLHEPRQGQCYARNTGIAAAEGDVILFTDDDVRPPKNWIEVMCQSILSGDGEATAGGVKFAPHLERDWMRTVHKLWLAHSESIPFPPDRMVGANMAFSRAVLEKVPGLILSLDQGRLVFMMKACFAISFWRQGIRLPQRWTFVLNIISTSPDYLRRILRKRRRRWGVPLLMLLTTGNMRIFLPPESMH